MGFGSRLWWEGRCLEVAKSTTSRQPRQPIFGLQPQFDLTRWWGNIDTPLASLPHLGKMQFDCHRPTQLKTQLLLGITRPIKLIQLMQYLHSLIDFLHYQKIWWFPIDLSGWKSWVNFCQGSQQFDQFDRSLYFGKQ